MRRETPEENDAERADEECDDGGGSSQGNSANGTNESFRMIGSSAFTTGSAGFGRFEQSVGRSRVTLIEGAGSMLDALAATPTFILTIDNVGFDAAFFSFFKFSRSIARGFEFFKEGCPDFCFFDAGLRAEAERRKRRLERSVFEGE